MLHTVCAAAEGAWHWGELQKRVTCAPLQLSHFNLLPGSRLKLSLSARYAKAKAPDALLGLICIFTVNLSAATGCCMQPSVHQAAAGQPILEGEMLQDVLQHLIRKGGDEISHINV
jgi:hypothetical protein